MSKYNFKNLYQKKDQTMDKKFIENIKQLIGRKLSDPDIAKKAAQIIEDMIQKKKKSHPKNQYKKSS